MRGESYAPPSVKVLGPLELEGFGGSVHLRRLKARQLLLVLVIERNRLVTRESLIDALWPGSVPSDPGASLRSYASIVHRALELVPGVSITSDREGYSLRLDDEMVDAFCFEQLVRQAHAVGGGEACKEALACLDAALSLLRGRPLEEAEGLACAAGEVRRLRGLLVDARERRVEVKLSLGRVHEAVADARVLVAENPYRERLWELYAIGLHRCGRTATALGAIGFLRRSLRDRFGIDIAPSLSQLETDLRRGKEPLPTPGPAASSPSSAPKLCQGTGPGPDRDGAPPTGQRHEPLFGDILGRDAELRSLQTLLSTSRLITLIGPGGAGKTRLAIEVVRRAEGDHVPFWCDVASAETSDQVEHLVSTSLGVPLEESHQSNGTLAEFIGPKPILLILDSCEPAIGALSDLVEFLLVRCPRLVILAASREPLHVPGEQLFTVGPPAVPGQPARQPTTQPDIERSYRLLNSSALDLLEALACFAGSVTLPQVIAVTSWAGQAGELVGGLADLIDKSLLEVEEVNGKSCYRLPDTVGAYVSARRHPHPRRIGPGTVRPSTAAKAGCRAR